MAKDLYGQETQPEVTTGSGMPRFGGSMAMAPGGPASGPAGMMDSAPAAGAPVIRTLPGTANMQGMTITAGQRNDELSRAQFIRPVDAEQCRKWNEKLTRYKAAKHKLDQRIIDSEEWWRMHNEFTEAKVTDAGDSDLEFRSKSAWLFNTLASKHADYIESYPMANIRARAEDDKGQAYMLSKVMPVILKQANFKKTYDLNGWQKLKIGTGIYKIIWDAKKENGLGNVAIVRRNMLNIFWEPGITDIQQSRLLFDVEMVDRETLTEEYPELKDQQLVSAVTPEKVKDAESVINTDKVAVIDVYYKRRGVLHYAKYVGETVIYATENDNEVLSTDRSPVDGVITGVHTKATDGLYDHGKYPYVFDVLFPIENSPAGFGYVDVCANAMTRIDLLNQAMLENAEFGASPRYFARSDGNINMDEFLNVKKKIVHVPGPVGEDALRLIDAPQLSGNHMAVQSAFISELRETSGNTEAGNGIAKSGVTAASAYAMLQEASGKLSRASTITTYDAFEEIIYLTYELIRQFYDQPRMFRIMGELGTEKYISFSNDGMKPQWQGMQAGQDMGYRLPEYDIDVVPERKSSYSKISQNELAMELYGKGFFNPQMTDQSLACLDMMDFDDKDEIMRKVAQNGTLFDQLRQWQQLALQLAAVHAPNMVQGLAESVTGNAVPDIRSESVASPGEGIRRMAGEDGQEPTLIKNARRRSNEASQPGGSTV